MKMSEKIRTSRKMNGMTQQELADKAGIHIATLSRYEKGGRVPSSDTLEKIAAALGMSASEFFDVPKIIMSPDHSVTNSASAAEIAAWAAQSLENPKRQEIAKLLTGLTDKELTLVIHFLEALTYKSTDED